MFLGLTTAQQKAVEQYYPQGAGFLHGLDVSVEKAEKGISVQIEKQRAVIRLENAKFFGRALLLLEDALSLGGEVTLSEYPCYQQLGLLLDCSRNAVPTFETFCKLIVCISKMGYTALQLYMEDTYKIEEYPYFGYRRGGYTPDQLRKMDAFAAQMGVELIPAVQTLAHLGQSLRWKAFEDVLDIDDILLVDNEKTYQLIDAMFRTLAESFSSRQVNIGMDEAHLVGLGAYLKQHGHQDRMQLMLRHFERVYQIAQKYGFHVMLWSDMFFRLATGGEYYSTDCAVDPSIRQTLPGDVSLIYWDYYSEDRSVYDAMFHKHKEMADDIVFAGGAWKWTGFCPGNGFSMHVADLAHASCVQHNVQRVMVTAWADNGAECSLFSILPALQYWAELCYTNGSEKVRAHFPRCCMGADFDCFLCLDEPQYTPGNPKPGRVSINPVKYLFYQDPLCGLFDAHVDPATYPAHFSACAQALALARAKTPENWQYLFDTMIALCGVLEQKCSVGLEIRTAYEAGDIRQLDLICSRRLPALKDELTRFLQLFHKQWLLENSAFGLDVIDLRIGGLIQRTDTAIQRIRAYVHGEIPRLEEVEVPLLPFEPGTQGRDIYVHYWHKMVSVSNLCAN